MINRDRLFANIREIRSQYPDIISDKQVKDIYEELKPLSNVDITVRQNHIADIKQKYDKPVYAPTKQPTVTPSYSSEDIPAPDMTVGSVDEILAAASAENQKTPDKPQELICPRCGSALVLRQAKKRKERRKQLLRLFGVSQVQVCKKLVMIL